MSFWMMLRNLGARRVTEPNSRCLSCRGSGKRGASSCDWCGGSGRRKRCYRADCQEYGCSGYGDCFVSKGNTQ